MDQASVPQDGRIGLIVKLCPALPPTDLRAPLQRPTHSGYPKLSLYVSIVRVTTLAIVLHFLGCPYFTLYKPAFLDQSKRLC